MLCSIILTLAMGFAAQIDMANTPWNSGGHFGGDCGGPMMAGDQQRYDPNKDNRQPSMVSQPDNYDDAGAQRRNAERKERNRQIAAEAVARAQARDRELLPYKPLRDSRQARYDTLYPNGIWQEDGRSRAATEGIKYAELSYQNKEDGEDGFFGKISDALLDLATSYAPGISWARDVYEAVTGVDFFTDKYLDSTSRGLAIVGAITGGFAKAPFKAILHFEKLTSVGTDVARTLLYSKSISELKQTMGFIKKHNIFRRDTRVDMVQATNAFMKNAKVRVLEQDMKVYRYADPRYSDPRGVWVTKQKLANPEIELALPRSGNYEAFEWTIPKGTEVLEGIVAPNFGKAGGASQILVDLTVLK